jgi:hypothetical protein
VLRNWLVASFVVFLPLFARADAPPYIPVQGYLESASGEPKVGATKLRFRLYDRAEPTGNPVEILHEETQTLSLSKGYFTTYLGDAAPLSIDIFRTNAVVFVGILVGDDADEVKPLLQLGTAPFAGQYLGRKNSPGDRRGSQIDFSAAEQRPGWWRWNRACRTGRTEGRSWRAHGRSERSGHRDAAEPDAHHQLARALRREPRPGLTHCRLRHVGLWVVG